jgi:manganese transport protein
VVLSLQLPFALVPLIRFTSARSVMGSYANRRSVSAVAASVAALVIACNGWLVVQTIRDSLSPAWMALATVSGVAAIGLLVYLAVAPIRSPDGASVGPLRDVFSLGDASPECRPA